MPGPVTHPAEIFMRALVPALCVLVSCTPASSSDSARLPALLEEWDREAAAFRDSSATLHLYH